MCSYKCLINVYVKFFKVSLTAIYLFNTAPSLMHCTLILSGFLSGGGRELSSLLGFGLPPLGEF